MKSDPTGLDPIENAVLVGLADLVVNGDESRCKTATMLADINRRHGYAHDDVHARILGLSRPWLTGLRLLDFNGNFGARCYEAAEPRYTEVGLTSLGHHCVAALKGEAPGLPVGFVLGDTYKGGSQPPLDPERVVLAIRAVADGASDSEVIDRLGPPAFPSNCAVVGDFGPLWSGEEVRLRLEARITEQDDGTVVIADLPPQSSEDQVLDAISGNRRTREALRDANWHWLGDVSQIVLYPTAAVAPHEVAHEVAQIRVPDPRLSVPSASR